MFLTCWSSGKGLIVSIRDDARDAGLLLRYALDPAAAPARLDVYGRLLDRFHTDPDLRSVFDEFTGALGVRVLAADRLTGLVMTPEPDSPLAVKDTSAWLRITGVPDRLVYGLALGAVAAWCYPNARAVREPATRRVTAIDVDRLIREHAAGVEAGDLDATEPLADAWNEYINNRKQVEFTKTKRLTRSCTVRMCEDALTMLAAFRLLVPDRTAPPPRTDLKVWRSTDRFRAHVAAGGGPLVWQTITASGVPDRLHREPAQSSSAEGEG
jgi:hypothetical protein